MKAYEIRSDRQGIEALTLVERPEPTIQAGQVLQYTALREQHE